MVAVAEPPFVPSAPHLRPNEIANLREFWRFIDPISDEVNVELMKVCLEMPEWAPVIRSMTPEQMARQNERGRALQRAALMDGEWGPYLADMHQQGMQYAKSGSRFASWFEILSAFRECIRSRVQEVARKDFERYARIADGMNHVFDIAMSNIGEAYLATKEGIIREQQEAIREISTPVLQVRDHLLIIPIVGVLETQRARLLTQSLLRAIRDRRAKGVVMDITGVPIVDSKVANHLAQACEAARLMGAYVVMTGISSEIALTMVTIGAELRGVRTMADLQSGIEEIEHYLAAGGVPLVNGLKSETPSAPEA